MNIPRIRIASSAGLLCMGIAAATTFVTANAQYGEPAELERSAQFAEPGNSNDRGGQLTASDVLVIPINLVEVPAEVEGVLTELKIEEGDEVRTDQIMAIIDATVADLTVQLKEAEEAEARIKASDDVNLRDAQNNKELADAEAAAFAELRLQGAIGKWDAKRKKLEANKQDLRIELAELDNRSKRVQVIIKQTELKIANEEMAKRRVESPVDGFVEQRLAQKGQWVQPGTPIAKVMRMDKLRVQGDLNGLNYPGVVARGMPVRVEIKTSADATTRFDGRLGFVSMNIDAYGNHRVWVDIENRREGDGWLIKPGMDAEITATIDVQ